MSDTRNVLLEGHDEITDLTEAEVRRALAGGVIYECHDDICRGEDLGPGYPVNAYHARAEHGDSEEGYSWDALLRVEHCLGRKFLGKV